jgi:hypothetical protein
MKLPAGGEEEVDLMMKASMAFSNGVTAALTSCPYALPETEGANCQFFIECQGSDGTLRFEYASMEGSDGSEVVKLGGQGTIEKRWLVSEVRLSALAVAVVPPVPCLSGRFHPPTSTPDRCCC